MKKLLNAIFLISGTAIGAGLLALPLVAINVGSVMTLLILLFMAFIAYQSSLMVVSLNRKCNTAESILELSRSISGRGAFVLVSLSFYLLSFALLTVYISGVASTLSAFFNMPNTYMILAAGGLLWGLVSLNVKVFSNINSFLVVFLLGLISLSVCKIRGLGTFSALPLTHTREIFDFIPIVFTSFGVQNVCHSVHEYLGGDTKKIKLAFACGIAIPTMVYILWILCVFQAVQTTDGAFFHRLQQHQVEVGELVHFLCHYSHNIYLEFCFKILTLFAIISSAAGIAIGLKRPMERLLHTQALSHGAIAIMPTVFAILIPNTFIHMLSFGGMIATVFVLFMPYYLMVKTKDVTFCEHICFLMGIFIVLCETIHILSEA